MNEKIREEFEAWASSPAFGLRAGHFVKGDDGEYLNYPTQCYLQVWQASRESLVIELPEQLMPCEVDPHTDLPLLQAGAVKTAIEAAGLKVKA